MNGIYLALGSNIQPRKDYLSKALTALDDHQRITVIRKSSIYQTAPVGYTDQADFLNMVIELDTSLLPLELLDVCQTIEKQLGRERDIRFGPRTVDLDILIYNQENRETELLTIPHPRMHERAFVLIPLSEIANELAFPAAYKTVSDYIDELPESDIKDVTLWIDKGSAEE
ncbi:2-amino-4-hydroxy-6-hydroxymethyldihydropteridine diphosphokinase [Lentibacillus amyloliquefaciens]|uniref:2-amino-4-hydroxy-6-hydroxymethyldihydropteridine diphosphokinase n=1 Tax=Lentibacillus amyloliquefaciens TaxID=1472767 RepID=A0A0U4FL78_9BACI|nr:2-amino-4-hydroxy-6-hydroxymethyldihydropteridine diphosphokinase [Lentibacillus amyloliquefaciens]ALX49422.1 2-amino-4-hydroxy-6-hydroxymethyldihydropteridine pyrophosphokinase [Lentibacillus amyloliquefaciens]